ncbi:alpha/beta hydrolase [Micromonospora sp. NPDC005206]|uniref:alpha/beta hydrolase n=1 Tax=Micromonospora sp. NPDC005206 TaxID=3157022 RepID=UPI0033A80C85
MPEFDPDVAAMLAARAAAPPIPKAHEGGLDQMRGLLESMPRPPAPDVATSRDTTIEGPHGPLRLRLYHPASVPDGPLPVVVYFHGGGMVMGSIDSFDSVARRLCDGCAAIVVSVDYRLAPEHSYPVGNDECYAATVWAYEHAPEFGGDPARIAVAGDSAGGSLAAAVALRARAEGPQLALQMLFYPGLERASVSRASMSEFADSPFLSHADVVWMKAQYLGADESRDTEQGVPSKAVDLAGLPPAIVVTAELDPLRDGGEAYGERLRAASVSTVLLRYPGVGHGFMMQAGWIARGTQAFDEACALARVRLRSSERETAQAGS